MATGWLRSAGGGWAGVGIGLLVAALAGTAQAEAPPRVVLVANGPENGATIRIERELRALGVEVVVIEGDPATAGARGPLEAAAREVGAFAAIRVVTTGDAAEVWVADRVTGKTVIREIVHGDATADDGEMALGAVELLRASLLELRVPAETEHGEVAPTPAIEQLAPPLPAAPPVRVAPTGGPLPAPRGPRDAFAASFGVVTLPGLRRVGPLYGAGTSVAGRFGNSPWGLETTLLAALGHVESRGSAPAARADATVAWVGAGPTWSSGGGRLVPRFGAGLAAVYLDLRGVAAAPLVALREHAWLAAPFVRGGLAVVLSPRFRARADAWLAAALAQAEVRLDGQRVATFGRPELALGTSLEVIVP